MGDSTPKRERPLSPNIQIYRPQLTSVLSIANRMTGIVLGLCAVALVVWLLAAAAGPDAYLAVHRFFLSWAGQMLLFACTYLFYLHLCGGIRHLVWDAVYGFELRTIYASGWIAVIASVALTIITWAVRIGFVG